MLKDSFKNTLSKINNGWVRLAVFIIVMINTGATMMGFELLPFSDQQIVSGLSVAAMVISEVWNHYKNNDYSKEAKHATNYLRSMKEQNK